MYGSAEIEQFVGGKKLALVGVSRSGRGFGSIAFKELQAAGYEVFPVNPNVEEIGAHTCYPSIASIPEPVDGVVITVPPPQTEAVVRDAAEAGVRRVWMQTGAASDTAVQFCRDRGISVIHHECILMYANPHGMHRFHGWIRNAAGKLFHIGPSRPS
jgi:uncharacterized protein